MVPIQTPSTPQLLSEVVEKLCASYYEPDLALNHLRESVLPSRQATLQILSDIKDLIFPDHRLDLQLRSGQTGFKVGGMLEKLHEELRHQIYCARSYDYTGDGPCPSTPEQADQDSLLFLGRLPALREMLALDVQAALEGDPAARSSDEIIFCYPGFEAVASYRIAHELYLLGAPLLPRMMAEEAHSRTGCDIHPGAAIGRWFFIDHATGVVIGETSLIGERVTLYQGVTLGALSPRTKDDSGQLVRGRKRHPTIEDDVVIYAGATVLGGETIIGAGSTIGGSCWITHSIPAGTKVLLSEPQMKFRGPNTSQLPLLEPDWVI